MGTYLHSEELNDEAARISSLLPDAIEAFRRVVHLTLRRHSERTRQHIQITDTSDGISAYKPRYPAGAVRFRFSAADRLAVMSALFRGSPEQTTSAHLQVRASVVTREGELWFAVDDEERALSPADLAGHWLTWFFERI